MEHGSMLQDALIYLAAAVIGVPLAKRLGLGSVLGYLLAGILIGPYLLGLVGEQKDVMHFAEFGVVLMLFLVGLELKPALLWQLKGPILGTGGLQLLLTTGLLTLFGRLCTLPWQESIAIGLILALSSTAIVLQSLQERRQMQSESGRSAFAVLLLQDIAVIPILALLPLLALQPAELAANTGLSGWQQGVVVAAAISGIVLGGHYVMRPIFRAIAQAHMREIFVAAALLLVVGIAVLMESVGLSPALGSFLAGVVLADSEYRHELEADIEPFKGLLLGLFFMSVGAGINFHLFADHPLLIPALVIGLMLTKWGVLMGLGKLLRMSPSQNWTFALALAQGGEFAFVLFSFAGQTGVLSDATTALLTLVVTLSMALTPLLLIANDRLIQPRYDYRPQNVTDEVPPEPVANPVLIAGFGRFGQIVGRLLHGHGIGTTILEQDPSQIEMLRKFGYQVFYGDASRLDLLHAAGAHQARLLVLAVNDPATAVSIIETVRKHFPHLKILARAQDRPHAHEILRHGVDRVFRETLGSAVDLGVEALTQLGFRANQAWRAGQTFKRHDNRLLHEQTQYLDDEHTYINKSLQYRDILADLLQDDEEEQARIRTHAWDSENPQDHKEAT
ncbi:Kef-type potassium/proton antiporter, CPA2 family [Aeromonas sp. RU39B]|jgi:monovalent cation:proton antiporter-2 (CPA2) family protein|uniref:monovalent cation:proton antiporter-2 (CPA2) family protein n=1 Tax=Aeromonas sp. RU39B TaxID=1907416 RepID=UPI0009552C4A|nr:monovalent cation:proton antiporter-2 (CPA2) family protein [Aeromonas sp. RU39B]SIR15336.1 Kef-type potassium/proton antiporter, CPA2 family [Aeromonas sp. RU39B]